MSQFCTIVARNYLPQVRCLAASLHGQHPGASLTVLVVDGEFGRFDPAAEPFDVIDVGALGGDQVELRRMAMLYDVLEYSTSLKPWLLQTLLDRGASSVVYLDPDIQVYAPLDELERLSEQHQVVLTPHATAPMPRDGRQMTEATVLSSGVYNLGFIGVGPASGPFLDFWKERLARDCVIDPQGMRFVDQRWIDLVPGLFDTAIVKDPSYNVAFWNLDHRELSFDGERFLVDGSPLHFFHFSGYNPQQGHLLSRHQGTDPRILLSQRPALRRLCGLYGEAMVANGYGPDRLAAYGFAHTGGGLEIDRYIRHACRTAVERADRGLEPYPPDPWEISGDDAFVAWLNSPVEIAGRPGRLSRYLAAVHAIRPDLHAAFPDPEGLDYRRFMYWARHEVRFGHLPGRLGFGTPDAAARGDGESLDEAPYPRWPARDQLHPGFCVVGYLTAELGLGESGRLVVAALESAGLPYATMDNHATMSRRTHPFEVTKDFAGGFDTNLIIVNADQLDAFRQTVGPEFFAGRHTIGQWAWEAEDFPDWWRSAFDYVDEIWGISEFTARSIARATDKPVFAAPLPIVAPDVPAGVGRVDLGLPEDRFLFLFCFDLLSTIERKNPLGLIDAFKLAFAPGEGPMLVIKAINGQHKANELERLKFSAEGRDDILLIEHYLDPGHQAALMAVTDCYASLHRAEGFGLTMAEAMALGKPVIATAYSANLEFMDDQTAYLVDWSPGAVPAGSDPYMAGSIWADPDPHAAAARMRHVYEHQDEARATGARARESIRASHGPDARARFYAERFAAIQKSREAPAPVAPPDPVVATVPPPATVARRVLRRMGRRWPTAARVYRRTARLASGRPEPARAVQRPTEEAVAGLDGRLAGIEARLDGVVERVSHLDGRLDAVDAELHAVPYMSDPGAVRTVGADGRPAIGYRSGRGPAAGGGYSDFEDLFRGSEQLITDRQRVYLPLLVDRGPVLDAGCGRGEMLAALDRLGVEVLGVDTDASMVDRCRAAGLKVECADMVSHLRSLPPGSLGAIFSAQVVEHLEAGVMTEFLAEARRVLQPDGVLVVETVNPHSVAAFKTFWTDPTHLSPIFPEVAVTLCRTAGFAEAVVVWPNGSGDLDVDRRAEGEYAVVARP